MLILGLDISTTTTAYTLINTDNPESNFVVKYDGIHLSKKKSLYDKADVVREQLKSLSKEYKIDKVYAEESLQSFRRGLSSAKTLSTLSRFNGVICFIAEDIFGVETHLVNVLHARSKLSIKINRKSESSTKDQVLDWAMSQKSLENIEWPKKTLKSGPRAGMTINDPSCYDIADAAVMSLYGVYV